MTAESALPPRPYRWSLSAFGGGRPDQLGTLPAPRDQSPPDGLVLAELTAATAKVLARSDGAGLCFLGRSLDSMYDLLTGALEHSPWDGRLLRLPVSCTADTHWSPAAGCRFREHLASVGLEPYALARRRRPIALVDVVAEGRSYGTLHRRLADWIEETRDRGRSSGANSGTSRSPPAAAPARTSGAGSRTRTTTGCGPCRPRM